MTCCMRDGGDGSSASFHRLSTPAHNHILRARRTPASSFFFLRTLLRTIAYFSLRRPFDAQLSPLSLCSARLLMSSYLPGQERGATKARQEVQLQGGEGDRNIVEGERGLCAPRPLFCCAFTPTFPCPPQHFKGGKTVAQGQ